MANRWTASRPINSECNFPDVGSYRISGSYPNAENWKLRYDFGRSLVKMSMNIRNSRVMTSATAQHTIEIRVEYNETDGQGRVHHAQYINYFERGRVELLRSLGFSYRELEESGLLLVVSELNIRYLGAAAFDDILHLTTSVVRTRGTRIEHHYELERAADDGSAVPIVTGSSVVASVDRSGKVRKLPAYLRGKTDSADGR